MAHEQIVNLSDPREKQMLLQVFRGMEGKHRIQWCQHRARRSDRQNRYYWPCFVQPFTEFLRAQGEFLTEDEAHELLKAKFLRRSIMNLETGEVVGETVPSTTTLDTAEFNEYLDNCAAWLADMFGIVVPEPNQYHETETAHAVV